jgi:Flp pilus assembly pilin Flp
MKRNQQDQSNATHNERGATMVEYALMVALILIGSVASIGSIGKESRDTFRDVDRAMAYAQGGIQLE